MPRLTPALEFDKPEQIRRLVMKITEGSPGSAENLIVLLRLVSNPERSQIVNSASLEDAVNYAFCLTPAFDAALNEFVREPLRAVA